MPARLALIHNPRSRRNLHDPDGFAAQAKARLGAFFISPSNRHELADDIRQLAEQDVRFIAVNGGDGTVSDVLSAVLASYPADRLPALAVLPSGNTNLIASDVGCQLRGLQALTQLQERAATGTLMEGASWRQPVIVSWSDPGRLPVAGMFCGLAAFTRGIELAHNPAILDRYSHDMAVFVTVLWAIRQLLQRETRRKWLNGTPMILSVDHATPDARPRFLFLCTGLHRLSRGVWPFWQDHEPQGGISYLDILANPPGLLRNLFCVLRGRIPDRLRQSAAYRSGMAGDILIETRDHLVIDGEELDPGPDGRIRLVQGPRIAFIRS
ncbi:diacylglycerol kinase [Acetobacter musti]|uniref:Diacylglycerol kinase n=1 Tax=Acetobacter musti TaxID=864732 RepID=A0ABX0JSU8_9PROT|nr:diacylglycerol kinase [Acetobacter musti]